MAIGTNVKHFFILAALLLAPLAALHANTQLAKSTESLPGRKPIDKAHLFQCGVSK